MSSEFDAYYEWLGIPPREHPPTAYRLLGLDLYEKNADVIQNAAERQTSYVRSRQLGKQQNAAHRLLNEISAARVMLLDPLRKAEYDASLAADRGPTASAAPLPPPLLVSPPVGIAAAVPASKPEPPRAIRQEPPGASWGLSAASPLVWGLAAAGVFFIGLAGYLLSQVRSGPSPPSAVRPPPATTTPVEIAPAETETAIERVRPARPPKRPQKERGRKRKGDPKQDPDMLPIEPTLPVADVPAAPPPSEKELDDGLLDLADSLLDKLTRGPASPPVDPLPAKDPRSQPLDPAGGEKLPVAPTSTIMAYFAEPMQDGVRVTIYDTPFGTATVLLEGDFSEGTSHKLTRRVPPPAGFASAGQDQPLLEVDIVSGKVTRVAWDRQEIPSRK